MKIVTWNILIALFLFTENATAVGLGILSPKYLDITAAFKTVTREIFLVYKIVGETIGFDENRTYYEEFDGNKIKIKNEECDSAIRLPRNSSKILQAEVRSLVTLDVHLRGYNQSFVTERFPFNIAINQFNQYDRYANDEEVTWKNNFISNITLPNLDNLDIKLLPNKYKYKSSEEENQIKQKIKTTFMDFYDAKFKTIEEIKRGLEYLRGLSTSIEVLSQNSDEFYYLIGTISTPDYTLNNVTIKSFGTVESFSRNGSNPVKNLEMKLSNVSGDATLNYPASTAEPLELKFGMENLYISKSPEAKFEFKSIAYWFMNKKSKALLDNGSLKNFGENFESAFTNSFAKV